MNSKHRGYPIRRTGDGNYYCPALEGTAKATNIETLKKWIDQAIAIGELKRVEDNR